jgi:hypothetical protein
MPSVYLGNHAALDHKGEIVDGQQVTCIHIPEEDTHGEVFRTITHADGLWPKMAAEDAKWVASDNERLARALSAHFDCPIIDLGEAGQKYAHAMDASAHGAKPEEFTPGTGNDSRDVTPATIPDKPEEWEDLS